MDKFITKEVKKEILNFKITDNIVLREKIAEQRYQRKLRQMKKEKRTRCRGRMWDIQFSPPIVDKEKLFDHYKKTLPEGIYTFFAIDHIEEGKPGHTHVSVVFSKVPGKLYWEDLYTLFHYGRKPDMVSPLLLAKQGAKIAQITNYEYCIDKSRHEKNEIKMESLFVWRFPYEEWKAEIKKIAASKDSYDVYVLREFEEKGASNLKDVAKAAPIKIRAKILMNWKKLITMIQNFYALQIEEPELYTLDSFKPDVIKKIQDEWVEGTQLVLKGPTDCGKTELACSYLFDKEKKAPLFMNEINQLGMRTPGQSMIFDDMNFGRMSRSKGIALFDYTKPRGIRILFGVHNIEANATKIFTTNEDKEEFLPYDEHDAITRRISWIDLTEFGKLYKTSQA